MRNASLRFVCREVKLEVANADTAFTRGYAKGQVIRCPVAHHDGNYFADAADARPRRGQRPGRLPLRRGHQPQRLDQRHRRRLQRQEERPRPDAAPREPDRGGAQRHRRPRTCSPACSRSPDAPQHRRIRRHRDRPPRARHRLLDHHGIRRSPTSTATRSTRSIARPVRLLLDLLHPPHQPRAGAVLSRRAHRLALALGCFASRAGAASMAGDDRAGDGVLPLHAGALLHLHRRAR